MLKNDQRYFKKLAVTERFLKYVSSFFNIMHEIVGDSLEKRYISVLVGLHCGLMFRRLVDQLGPR